MELSGRVGLCAVVVQTAAGLVAACTGGGNATPGAGPTACDGPGCTEVVPPPDGGPQPDAGGTTAGNCTGGPVTGDASVTTTYYGWIGVVSTPANDPSAQAETGVLASFARTADVTPAATPVIAAEGPCKVQDIPIPAPGSVTLVGAGTLSIEVGGTTLPVPKLNGNAYGGSGSGALFQGCVRARATGEPGGAPAFDVNVAAPSRVTVTAPVVTGGALSQARSQPLGITWTGGANGSASVTLTTLGVSPARGVACLLDASAGSVTIPADLMSRLPAGKALLQVGTATNFVGIQGDWTFELSATARATGGSASVTLQ